MLNTKRLLCSDLVWIEWQVGSDQPGAAPAVLDNISTDEACLQLECPIPAETMVRLVCGSREFRGKVRYCRYSSGTGYTACVSFSEGYTWGAEQYRPRYSIDPDSLDVVAAGLGSRNCTACPPCDNGQRCPHLSPPAAAGDGAAAADKVRLVAEAVARVCPNLDNRRLRSCYYKLYGDLHRTDMSAVFEKAYRQALQRNSESQVSQAS